MSPTTPSPSHSRTTVRTSNLVYSYPDLRHRVQVLSRNPARLHQRRTSAAIRGVTLEITQGESLGLVGSNGAGKTTLLRLLAGIFEADEGTVQISGRVTTMFDSGYGLDPNLSPRQNIIIRGLLLRRPRDEIEEAIQDIREFVDLGDSWNAPLRTYSTGMSSRVVVGLATAFNSDILLMDEAIGAADIAFQEKAAQRFEEQLRATGSLIMATHNRKLMTRFCSRAILLSHGEIVFEGEVEEAWELHQESH